MFFPSLSLKNASSPSALHFIKFFVFSLFFFCLFLNFLPLWSLWQKCRGANVSMFFRSLFLCPWKSLTQNMRSKWVVYKVIYFLTCVLYKFISSSLHSYGMESELSEKIERKFDSFLKVSRRLLPSISWKRASIR